MPKRIKRKQGAPKLPRTTETQAENDDDVGRREQNERIAYAFKVLAMPRVLGVLGTWAAYSGCELGVLGPFPTQCGVFAATRQRRSPLLNKKSQMGASNTHR